MARQKEGERALGPYHDRSTDRWRVTLRGGPGTPRCRSFATREEAEQYKRSVNREIELAPKRTVKDALDAYELHMREKGNKPVSITETIRRLRVFFADPDLPLYGVDHKRAAGYYDTFRQRRIGCTKEKPEGRPVSVDYHRNMLAEAKSFLRWCVKQRWIACNPLDGVEGIGRRRRGKLQLRIDEARKWEAKARQLADGGEEGAAAALLALYMNLRCKEIVGLVARDVDDDGRVLWVSDSKTDAGRRRQAIPQVMRDYLLELAEGRQPADHLFSCTDRAWPRHWVQRICEKAGVPVVCAHGLRGTHSSLAQEWGQTSKAVAAAMGHTTDKVTLQSYTDPSAVSGARQRRVLKVLEGGKRNGKRRATRRPNRFRTVSANGSACG